MRERTLVFGYASLVDPVSRARTFRREVPAEPARLPGFRRRWQVAMDNRVDLPRYVRYLDPASGRRPPVAVVFLDVVPDPGSTVNGCVFEVSPRELCTLDRRERTYRRVDLNGAVQVHQAPAARGGVGGRVVTYTGTPTALARYEIERGRGRARVPAAYLGAVRRAFEARGVREMEAFEASTDPPEVVVAELVRVDDPGAVRR